MAAVRSSPASQGSPRGFLDTIGGFGVRRQHARVILTLAWPVILGMLTQTAVNLVDTAMVGRLPEAISVPGQAALGISLPLYWAIGGFLSSIQVGTQAVASRRFGEGNAALSGRALTNSLAVAFSASIVLSAVAIWSIPHIFPLLDGDAQVVRWGVPYLQVRLIGVLSMVATASAQGFFDGIGRTYVHLVAAVVMNLLNIFGDWVLVFGHLGAPAMGPTGAAVASTVATYVGLAVMLGWTLIPEVRRRFRPFHLGNLSPRVMWDIIRFGIPSGVATVAMMTGFLMFLKIVAHLDAVAGHGAVFTAATKVIIDILSITFMSCIAFGTATATLVGQAMGKGKPRRAELYGWASVKLGLYIFGVFGALTAIWPELLIAVFSKDQAVIQAAIPVLRMLGCVEGLIAAAMILMQAMFGAGAAKFVMYVELCLHFLCLVPLAYLFGVVLDLKLVGMWFGAVVYVFLVVGIMGYTFYRGHWKHIEV